MTEPETVTLLQRWWKLSRGRETSLPLVKMLRAYRALKKDGKSDNDIVIYWSSPTVGMDRMDAGTFVAAMKEIDAKGTVQDPYERPSMQEVLDESGLPLTKKFPWVKVTVIGAVALFVVWGLPNLVKATRDSGHHKKVAP